MKLWILGGAVLLACSWWGMTVYQAHARWSNLLAELRLEPGVVITKAEATWGGYYLEGLRDPSAKDPALKIVEAGLVPGTIMAVWSPYYSLEPMFVEARAKLLLQPPETIQLNLEGATLIATGSASAEWAKEARRLAVLVPGISSYRDDGLITTAISDLLDQVHRTVVHFRLGSSSVEPPEHVVLNAVARVLRDLDHAAVQAGQGVSLKIYGSADETGSEVVNIPLSQARANAVRLVLGGERFGGATTITTHIMPEVGQPGPRGESADLRVASFRVTLVPPMPDKELRRP